MQPITNTMFPVNDIIIITDTTPSPTEHIKHDGHDDAGPELGKDFKNNCNIFSIIDKLMNLII